MNQVTRLISRRVSPSALRQGTIMLIATSVVNVLNYGFHVFTSRSLGPADYGAFVSLLALLGILTLPAGMVQTVTAQYVSQLKATQQERRLGPLVMAILVRAGLYALIVAILLALGSALVADFLQIASPWPVIALASVLIPAFAQPVFVGVVQGLQRFGLWAANLVLGVVARLGSGVILILLGWGASGALGASTISMVLALLVILWPIWPILRRGDSTDGAMAVGIYGYSLLVLITSLCFTMLTSVDLIVVKHFFSPVEAGYYSAASTLGKTVLFLPGAVGMVMFPKSSARRFAQESPAGIAKQSLVVAALLCIPAILVLWLFPIQAVSLLFGPGYEAAATLVTAYGTAMGVLALVNVLILYYLSIESRRFLAVLGISTLGLVGLLAVFHDSLLQVIGILLGSGLFILVASEIFCKGLGESKKQEIGQTANPPSAIRHPQSKISVLIPAYNEEAAILNSIQETAQVLAGNDYEIIVIDDGSHDQTHAQASLGETSNGRVKAVRYDTNQGKGHALRYGFEFASGDLVVFLDADLELHPWQIKTLLDVMQREDTDVVIGSKRHPQSKLIYPWHRRLVSFVYFALVKLLFGLPIRDTQTGLKLFKKEVLQKVMPRLQVNRFAFDLEILALAHHFGYRIAEAPVELSFQRRHLGRIGWRDIRTVWMDTLAILWRMQVRRSYD